MSLALVWFNAVVTVGWRESVNKCSCVWQVALLLIRHGADVDVEDGEGFTVLGRASIEFRPALIDAAKTMVEGWWMTTLCLNLYPKDQEHSSHL